MNATERQSQGTGIYAEEAFSVFQTERSRAGSAWLFLRAWTFPLTPCPLPPGEGECDGAFGEISTRPVSPHREERFSNNTGRKSGVAAESSPVKPSQTQSNQIKVNQASLTSQTRRTGNPRHPKAEAGEKIKITKRTQFNKCGSYCTENDYEF